MNFLKEKLSLWWLDLKLFPKMLKFRIYNKHILRWWYRHFCHSTEFHRSLDLDIGAMMVMNEKELRDYLLEMIKKREIAHQRTIHH